MFGAMNPVVASYQKINFFFCPGKQRAGQLLIHYSRALDAERLLLKFLSNNMISSNSLSVFCILSYSYHNDNS